MVPGGRAFIWPWVQKVQKISLNTMTLTVESPNVYSQQGVPISVTGIAQVKIPGQNSDMLKAACEQFLGKTEEEMTDIVRETLEGHQRAIIASMTVEEIYKNRKRFSKKVFEVASSDLVDMGFLVISYAIKDVSDEEGYLKSLGLARTSEVKRDARIGEAEAKRDAIIKEAEAEEQAQASKFANEAEIAKAQRDFEMKKASFDNEVMAKRAKSDMVAEYQSAKTRQEIKDKQMQIQVIEREKEVLVQEQEALRKQKELEATVRKPAIAEKEKMETLAAAYKKKAEIEAEAEAKAIRIKSHAQAQAIDLKAKAESDQMARKAVAFSEYKDAANVAMILETLPRVTAEIAGQLSECSRITMVSNGEKAEIGAKKMIDEILQIVTTIGEVTQQITGHYYKTGHAIGPPAPASRSYVRPP